MKHKVFSNVVSFFLIAGRPPPEVSWHLAGKLIDNTYQREAPNLTVNQLNNMKLTREHLNGQLTCEARNAPSVEPVTKLVILNINRKYNFNVYVY